MISTQLGKQKGKGNSVIRQAKLFEDLIGAAVALGHEMYSNSAAGNNTSGAFRPAGSLGSGGFAFNTGNSAFGTGNAAFGTGNSAFNTGNSAFGTGNTAFGTGNAQSTTSFGSVQSGNGSYYSQFGNNGTATGSTFRSTSANFGVPNSNIGASAFQNMSQSSPFAAFNTGKNSLTTPLNATNNAFASNTAQTSPLSAQKPQVSQTASAFNSTVNQSPFGNPTFQNTNSSPMAAKSSFGQPQINVSPFAQSQPNTTSAFAKNSLEQYQLANNVFGTANPPQNTISANIKAPGPYSSQSAFGSSNPGLKPLTTSASSFGLQAEAFKPYDQQGLYPDPCVLSDSDREAFNADQFQMGSIPEVTPPSVICG